MKPIGSMYFRGKHAEKVMGDFKVGDRMYVTVYGRITHMDFRDRLGNVRGHKGNFSKKPFRSYRIKMKLEGVADEKE